MRTTPMVASPRAMMTTPKTRTMPPWWRSSTDPASVAPTPRAVKTVVKPATNSSDARTVTRRASRSPSSATGRAEM